MQKAESLSFQTVLGLEGCGQSLISEISIRAVIEIVISMEFWCDLKTRALFRNNESPNNSYVIFYGTENYISTWRDVICWSFYRDVICFVGPVSKFFMLLQNVPYIDAYTTLEHLTAWPLWSHICDHFFFKLRASLITFRIFVRWQRLIARNVRQLFSSNCGVSDLNKACSIDDASRGSLSGPNIR